MRVRQGDIKCCTDSKVFSGFTSSHLGVTVVTWLYFIVVSTSEVLMSLWKCILLFSPFTLLRLMWVRGLVSALLANKIVS